MRRKSIKNLRRWHEKNRGCIDYINFAWYYRINDYLDNVANTPLTWKLFRELQHARGEIIKKRWLKRKLIIDLKEATKSKITKPVRKKRM